MTRQGLAQKRFYRPNRRLPRPRHRVVCCTSDRRGRRPATGRASAGDQGCTRTSRSGHGWSIGRLHGSRVFDGDRHSHSRRYGDPVGQLALGPRGAGGDLVLVEQVEGRDVPAVDPRQRVLARRSRPAGESRTSRVDAKPAARSSRSERVAVREARAVDPLERREERGSARSRRSATGSNVASDARPTRRRARAGAPAKARGRSTRWSDELRHRPLEPAVLERQVLGAPALEPDALRHPPARDLDHLRLGVDAPHLRRVRSASAAASRPVPQPTSSTRRPRRSPSRTSSVEELPPVRVRRAELVVDARRARPKSGLLRQR